MKESIETEKAKLQALFDGVHREGSYMRLEEKRYEPIDFGLINSYLVTRVAPVFSADGEIKKVDFWLFWKSAGYDLGFQYAHTIKVVSWIQEDSFQLDLVDDRGRRFHIEGLVPPEESIYVAEWARWKRYKHLNAEQFAEIDAALLETHLRIAEEWEAEA